MKCPFCEKEIDGPRCPECLTVSPEGAKYCMECGFRLSEAINEKEVPSGPSEDDAYDIDKRVLCPDGTCTGIIVNGKCTECGKSFPE